jgi:hypothetical protein
VKVRDSPTRSYQWRVLVPHRSTSLFGGAQSVPFAIAPTTETLSEAAQWVRVAGSTYADCVVARQVRERPTSSGQLKPREPVSID